MKKYQSNGKLLLTGEYALLDGALSLAIPTKLGQGLSVKPTDEKGFFWKSYTNDKKIWYESQLFTNSSDETTRILEKILETAMELNPKFQAEIQNVSVETTLDFPRDWGLGSSSTLINNIANWAEVPVYALFFKSFAGSGYDIACAHSNSPLLYQLNDGKPVSYPVFFAPKFKEKLFFVHLNRKQNSREGIERYKKIKKSKKKLIQNITEITENIVRDISYEAFCEILLEHETYISEYIQLETIKNKLFSDFQGTIKSLGAWGGDFILATGEEAYVKKYFPEKGFHTILSYSDLFFE